MRRSDGLPRSPNGGRHALALAALAGCALVVAVLPGCGGCGGCRGGSPAAQQAQAQREQEKAKAEAERRAARDKPKPKPDFELGRLTVEPFAVKGSAAENPLSAACKPGHWVAVTVPAKTNHFDFHGDLETAGVDRFGRPARLVGSLYGLRCARQAALPKGQPKLLSSTVFVPCVPESGYAALRLKSRRGGTAIESGAQLLPRMPSYQYLLVVLAAAPSRYGYLDTLASIRPPDSFDRPRGDAMHYRVVRVAASRPLPLPPHPVYWTSTAYVLWDDFEPSLLDPDQQRALVDWLHWGGQIILSGPDSLDRLRSSFLAAYLPADSGGSREYSADSLEPLDFWRVDPEDRAMALARPISGIRLAPRPGAEFLPETGELFCERHVGRGRIVVSAVRLSQPELTSWSGFDCLFNACLLRRPPRRFVEDERTLAERTLWDDGTATDARDAARTTALRYFTRDAGFRRAGPASYGADVAHRDDAGLIEDLPPAGGLAAWNDFGPATRAARQALEAASRIRIPRREFVAWVVVGYLVVLVPVNWLLFRLLGRVEWAWAAAPVVAVLCTAVVVRLAQLDIGFVRSRNEIAILELQGNYSRAHLTRYNALYTSLATAYTLRLADRGGVALPLPETTDPVAFRPPLGAGTKPLRHVLSDEARLEGFSVASNSVGMVHSEEMIELSGAMSLAENRAGGFEVVNGTELELSDAWLIHHSVQGDVRRAWIGSLGAGRSAPVLWSRRAPSAPPAEPAGAGVASASAAAGLGGVALPGAAPEDVEAEWSASSPGIQSLLAEALDAEDVDRGEWRLVAQAREDLPGLTIEPAASQFRRIVLVVAHLRFESPTPPRPDHNRPRRRTDPVVSEQATTRPAAARTPGAAVVPAPNTFAPPPAGP